MLSGTDLGRQWEQKTPVRVMTAYVAHELNHPLGTILNLVNTLLAKPEIGPQGVGEALGRIKAEALRASMVVKQLRLLTEPKPTTRSSVCLAEVCRETIERISPLADAKLIRIGLEVRAARTHVNGSKSLLEMVLYNLLLNGIAALDDPEISARKIVIRIITRGTRTTAVQVLDNGCGLPEETRDRIFEPFVTTRADGNGLGLAIAGDIARWHHGCLSCRSMRGKTCMEMTLPSA